MKVRTKIDSMHLTYGAKEGCRCGDCCNLVSLQHSRICYKCLAYGMTGSRASDWRMKWVACGLYNKDISVPPTIHSATEDKKEEPMEGQIDIFAFCETFKV